MIQKPQIYLYLNGTLVDAAEDTAKGLDNLRTTARETQRASNVALDLVIKDDHDEVVNYPLQEDYGWICIYDKFTHKWFPTKAAADKFIDENASWDGPFDYEAVLQAQELQ